MAVEGYPEASGPFQLAGGPQRALGCLRRCCGDIWLPNIKIWAGDKSNRPTLNCRNTQSSNHQLYLVLVSVRKLETQSSAETCPRSHCSLEPAATNSPSLCASSSALSSHCPSTSPSDSTREKPSACEGSCLDSRSQCGPGTCSSHITWEPVRSANSWVLPWTCWGWGPAIGALTSPLVTLGHAQV